MGIHCNICIFPYVQIDKALQTYERLLEKDPDHMPAILGLATGYMVEKSEVRVYMCICV